MPFYEYVCPGCGHKETAMRKVAERDNGPKCVDCSYPNLPNGRALDVPPTIMERVKVSEPAFHLKGKGWAADGYGGK